MTFDDIAARGLVLLGCGKMGSALLEGWLAGGVPPASVHVLEPKPSDRLRALAEAGLSLNAELPADAAVAVIAVKPQMMGEALPRLTALGGGGTLVLSIAAGTTLAALEAAFGPGTPIVRAMPNTPAAVGRGISVLIGNAAADEAAVARAEALLAAVGETARLESEAQMDAVTALSGSGPAYVFHLIEAMTAAGVAQGLSPDLAMRLSRATVIGAGRLAESNPASAAQLRIDVTSPGGVTAAALGVLMAEDRGVSALMCEAVAAGTERSRALGT